MDFTTTPTFRRVALAEELLESAIAALRQGDFDALISRHPRVTRWMVRRHLPIVAGAGADGAARAGLAGVTLLLIRWALTRLRPDQRPSLDDFPDPAWTDLPAWRPVLALACHARLVAVPDFPTRYRRRPNESAVDNLCGLWDVGPSSYYRYIERARRALALAAVQSPDADDRLALRSFVVDAWGPAQAERGAWHRAQSPEAQRLGDPAAALWHAVQGDDVGAAVGILRHAAPVLAGEPDTDATLDRMDVDALPFASRVDFWLAVSALARTRQEPERELRALERALKVAQQADDQRLLGLVYGALGRFYEARDADRAFAAYEDSVKLLRQEGALTEDAQVRAALVTSLIRLAWMHVLRNHPSSRQLLDEADALHRRQALPDDLLGLLEQSWGEYWRVAGDLPRALRARHRALNAFERIGDRRSVLVTYLNLVLLHGEALQEDKAVEYAQRILASAQGTLVEPAIIVSTYGNLGVAHARSHHFGQAIDAFGKALDLAVAADLRLHANRMRLNLASANYGLFVASRDPDHERRGDQCLADFMRAPPTETTPSLVATAKGLKAEVLAEMPDRSVDRLLDDEAAEHEAEMAEISRCRVALKREVAPEQGLRRRLAIVAAYARIAAQERDATLQWANAQGLSSHALAELEHMGGLLGSTDKDRALDIAGGWKRVAGHFLDSARRHAIAQRLLRDGALSKSSYGEAVGVAPATASKHLALMTQLGLLVQTGRGPATRYRLPLADR